MAEPANPLINGIRYSFASIEFTINGQIFAGISEITYQNMLEPGEVRGTGPTLQGMTLGDLKAEGSVTLYKESDVALIQLLGPGFLTINFPIVVSYSSTGLGIVTDRIIGARFKGGVNNAQKGTDGITVKRDFLAFWVLENGVAPIPNLPTL